jgi:hypothetical protein
MTVISHIAVPGDCKIHMRPLAGAMEWEYNNHVAAPWTGYGLDWKLSKAYHYRHYLVMAIILVQQYGWP